MERVPGSQLAAMSLAELEEDLGLSTLQAKRVKQALAGARGLAGPVADA